MVYGCVVVLFHRSMVCMVYVVYMVYHGNRTYVLQAGLRHVLIELVNIDIIQQMQDIQFED